MPHHKWSHKLVGEIGFPDPWQRLPHTFQGLSRPLTLSALESLTDLRSIPPCLSTPRSLALSS